MELTDEDVRAILKLLEASSFGDLELETPEFRLTLSRSDAGGWTRQTSTLRAALPLPPAHAGIPTTDGTQAVPAPAGGSDAVAPKPGRGGAAGGTDDVPSGAGRGGAAGGSDAVSSGSGRVEGVRGDLVDVRTPLPGTFYRSPKPGAAPFVEVDAQVEKNTVVAIVETMKLMNSVYAGTSGRVAQICLKDGEFADQNAVLLRIAAGAA